MMNVNENRNKIVQQEKSMLFLIFLFNTYKNFEYNNTFTLKPEQNWINQSLGLKSYLKYNSNSINLIQLSKANICIPNRKTETQYF